MRENKLRLGEPNSTAPEKAGGDPRDSGSQGGPPRQRGATSGQRPPSVNDVQTRRENKLHLREPNTMAPGKAGNDLPVSGSQSGHLTPGPPRQRKSNVRKETSISDIETMRENKLRLGTYRIRQNRGENPSTTKTMRRSNPSGAEAVTLRHPPGNCRNEAEQRTLSVCQTE